jgi:hypothetical protein
MNQSTSILWVLCNHATYLFLYLSHGMKGTKTSALLMIEQ